jgi:hypothetical protein
MTSTDHCLEAERLLEHAALMLNTDVHLEDRAELAARQAVTVALASAHAALAGRSHRPERAHGHCRHTSLAPGRRETAGYLAGT